MKKKNNIRKMDKIQYGMLMFEKGNKVGRINAQRETFSKIEEILNKLRIQRAILSKVNEWIKLDYVDYKEFKQCLSELQNHSQQTKPLKSQIQLANNPCGEDVCNKDKPADPRKRKYAKRLISRRAIKNFFGENYKK